MSKSGKTGTVRLSTYIGDTDFDLTSRQMMIRRYGDIEINTEEFRPVADAHRGYIGGVRSYRLGYVGSETDGSKIHIPDNIQSCHGLFSGCDKLETPPVIPEGIKDVSGMFEGCSNLKEPAKFPDSVEMMAGVYKDCKSLKEPSEMPEHAVVCLAAYDGCESLQRTPKLTRHISNTIWMFANCKNIEYGSDVPANVGNASCMYENCVNLKGPVKVYGKDTITDKMYAGCPFFNDERLKSSEKTLSIQNEGLKAADVVKES